jgi:hypothetical protein
VHAAGKLGPPQARRGPKLLVLGHIRMHAARKCVSHVLSVWLSQSRAPCRSSLCTFCLHELLFPVAFDAHQHGRDLVLNFSYGEQVPPSCTLSTWPRPSFVRSLFLHLHHQLPTIATTLCSFLAPSSPAHQPGYISGTCALKHSIAVSFCQPPSDGLPVIRLLHCCPSI